MLQNNGFEDDNVMHDAEEGEDEQGEHDMYGQEYGEEEYDE